MFPSGGNELLKQVSGLEGLWLLRMLQENLQKKVVGFALASVRRQGNLLIQFWPNAL